MASIRARWIFLYLVTAVIESVSMSAQNREAGPPDFIAICEASVGCANIFFQNAIGSAAYTNGAIASFTITSQSETSIVLKREDITGIGKGLTAVYTGKREGDWVDGTLQYQWPGHVTGTASSKWQGIIMPKISIIEETKTGSRYRSFLNKATGWKVCADAGNTCTVPVPPTKELWTFAGSTGLARNLSGSIVTNALFIDRFDGSGLVMRTYNHFGYFTGLSGLYIGSRQGNTMKGAVVWVWPGHIEAPLHGNWTATALPSIDCDRPGAASIDVEAARLAGHLSDMLGNRPASFSCTLIAAKQNDPESMNRLAYLYHTGTGVAANDTQALFWIKKSADLRNIDGLLGLSAMYGQGFGTATDLFLARYYSDLAASFRQADDTINTVLDGSGGGTLNMLGNLAAGSLLSPSNGDANFESRLSHEESVFRNMKEGATRVQAEEAAFREKEAKIMNEESCSARSGRLYFGFTANDNKLRRRATNRCLADWADRREEMHDAGIRYLKCVRSYIDSNTIEKKCTYF